ncbi:MAG TPA: acyl carrier protein [Actinophytocola sp.]|uniref:acyl carrier protein n=1 Tax=Actinophytocola sp. TaxID=1872138 RepID=UPI002DBD459F|nr:acyl carrier protein [Actinophytocola sp.]HEU5471328.1 acyl carrier protein [Actinophytocola sp.]
MTPDFAVMLRPFLKYAGDTEITADSRLRDLGLDSMQAIELLFAIEDGYGVSLPDDKLVDDTFATAGGLWAEVARLRGGGAS